MSAFPVPPPEFIWSFIFTSGSWLTFCALVWLVITAYQSRTKNNDAPWVSAIQAILEDDTTCPPTASVDLPVEIMPHLLLGDKACTAKPDLLLKMGVTHVLNMAGRSGREVATHRALRAAGLELESFEGVEDQEEFPLIYAHQPKVSDFIRSVEKAGGKCLIHGVAGINRCAALATAGAPAVEPANPRTRVGDRGVRRACATAVAELTRCSCAAELMLHEQLPLLEAVRRVKQARRVVLQNHSFRCQLVALARSHGLLGDRPGAETPTQAAKKNS